MEGPSVLSCSHVFLGEPRHVATSASAASTPVDGAAADAATPPPPAAGVQVFVDDGNLQLVCIESNTFFTRPFDGSPGRESISFVTPGQVLHAKFSLQGTYLGIQRSQHTIDVIDVEQRSEVTITIKSPRNSALLGFHWVQRDFCDLVAVTNQGIECYKLYPKKQSWKLIKSVSQPNHWYKYSAACNLLLLSTGNHANVLRAYSLTPSTVSKLGRLEVEVEPASPQEKRSMRLAESEVVVARVYGKNMVFYVNAPHRQLSAYQVSRERIGAINTLDLYAPGDFRVHVVDNLLVVHNVSTSMVMLFDTFQPSGWKEPIADPLPLAASSEGGTAEYGADWEFLSPSFVWSPGTRTVWPVCVDLAQLVVSTSNKLALATILVKRERGKPLLLDVLRMLVEEQINLKELYNVFCNLTSIYTQTLRRKVIEQKKANDEYIPSPAATSIFGMPLLGGSSAPRAVPGDTHEPAEPLSAESYKDVSRLVLPDAPLSPQPSAATAAASPHSQLAAAMDAVTLQTAGAAAPDTPKGGGGGGGGAGTPTTPTLAHLQGAGSAVSSGAASPRSSPFFGDEAPATMRDFSGGSVVVTPADIYEAVFDVVHEAGSVPFSFQLSALMEYLRSLIHFRLPLDHSLFRFLILLLSEQDDFHQLHQLLQYHILVDSPQVAAQLLDLADVYPPAANLGIDMLWRLRDFRTLITVLLQRGRPLDALRVAQLNVCDVAVDVHEFLRGAAAQGDALLLFNMHSWFLSQDPPPDVLATLHDFHASSALLQTVLPLSE